MSDDNSRVTEFIGVRVTPELRARIELAARLEGLTTSAVARRACLRDLARIQQQPEDRP